MSPRGAATAEPAIASPIARLKVDTGPIAALAGEARSRLGGAPKHSAVPSLLKILILEDEPDDAEKMKDELRKAGLKFTAKRVATRAEFTGALETFAPDVVLADCHLPDYSGAEALAHERHVHPEIPVVIVTGSIGDEAAIDLLKAGAKDYVLKSNLVRLPFAVERSILVEEGIRARKAAEQALRNANTLLQKAEQIGHIGGWSWDIVHDVLVWSDEVFRIYGRDPGQWTPTIAGAIAAVHPDDRQRVEDAITTGLTRNPVFDEEFRIVRPDGSERITHSRAKPEFDETGKLVAATGTSHDVTESKRVEAALRESRQLIEGILNSIPARVFWKDKNLVYLGCNTAFARDAGFAEPEDIVGKDDYQMAWRDQVDLYRNADRQVIESGNSRLLVEEPQTSPEGQTLTLLTSKIPLRGANGEITGVLGTYMDITDRKRAEASLHEEEVKFRSLVEQNVSGIAIVREDGTIAYINPYFSRLNGYSTAETIGRPLAEFIPESERAVVAESLKGQFAGTGGPLQLVTSMLAKDGRTVDILVNASAATFEGRPASIAVVLDITEHEAAKRTLRRLNRTLETLSRGNEVLVRATSEDELLTEMCRVIVELGGYRMAWIGEPLQDAEKTVKPVAWAGPAADYFARSPIITWGDAQTGQGICGRTIRSGEPQTSQKSRADPQMASWSAGFELFDLASAAGFPLKDASGVFAVLVIYSSELDAFDADELRLLQELALDLAFGIRSLREHTEREELERRWRASLEATIGAIASTVEMRDPYTSGHQQRVAKLAAAIARRLSTSEHDIHGIYLAGIIHDVGKINIPSEILNKPGKLSELEFQLIQTHPQSGYDIVKGVDFPWPIALMVLQHHERLDGSGYPQGLKGDAMLPGAKILAVADAVEAMMSHRPYRPALGIDVALAEVKKGKGTLFEPKVVDACIALFRDDGFHFD